jgi:hypothetical protein
MSTELKRWRGLASLIVDAVEHGSSAVERVHLGTTNRTFFILEAVPGLREPAKLAHAVHDLSVRTVYSTIRIVNHAVGRGLEVAFDAAQGAGKIMP